MADCKLQQQSSKEIWWMGDPAFPKSQIVSSGGTAEGVWHIDGGRLIKPQC
jgi:hypothetical protein